MGISPPPSRAAPQTSRAASKAWKRVSPLRTKKVFKSEGNSEGDQIEDLAWPFSGRRGSFLVKWAKSKMWTSLPSQLGGALLYHEKPKRGESNKTRLA